MQSNQWSGGPGQQATAQQMWNSYQQAYPAYAYPYNYAGTPGYAPQAAVTAASPAPVYPYGATASYAYANQSVGGYAPYGAPMPGYAAHYASPEAYAQPAYSNYEMSGPPTKKRLTNESQLSSSASYASSGTASSQQGSATSGYAPHQSSEAQTAGVKRGSGAEKATEKKEAKEVKKNDWPESLRAYIERCYRQTPTQDRPELEKKLAEMVKMAEKTQTVWSRDWSKMAVPVTSSQLSAPTTTSSYSYQQPITTPYNDPSTSSGRRDKASNKSKGYDASSSAAYSGAKGSKKGKMLTEEEKEEQQRAQRASRFKANSDRSSSSSSTSNSSCGYHNNYTVEVSSYEDTEAIVGTSTTLEKPFLRLTERPVPSSVRPLSILKKSLALMMKKKEEGASWIGYLSEQMKSIRQDLVIQAIADEFALQVYETNARWCLENNDIPEFKRCLVRIDEFYNHLNLSSDNIDEFSCYSLLYHLLPEDFPSLNAELAALAQSAQRSKLQFSPAIRHAIRICEAYLDNNWTLFFHLSKTTHFLEHHLLNVAAERLRLHCLSSIFITYRPSVPLEWIGAQIGLHSRSVALAWFLDHECVFTSKEQDLLDSKESLKGLSAWEVKNRPGK